MESGFHGGCRDDAHESCHDHGGERAICCSCAAYGWGNEVHACGLHAFHQTFPHGGDRDGVHGGGDEVKGHVHGGDEVKGHAHGGVGDDVGASVHDPHASWEHDHGGGWGAPQHGGAHEGVLQAHGGAGNDLDASAHDPHES